MRAAVICLTMIRLTVNGLSCSISTPEGSGGGLCHDCRSFLVTVRGDVRGLAVETKQFHCYGESSFDASAQIVWTPT